MKLIGKQVIWNKKSGKPNPLMQEISGFGSLSILEVGESMFICGDYGLTTTTVKEIKEFGNEFEVYTKNSIYLVKIVNG